VTITTIAAPLPVMIEVVRDTLSSCHFVEVMEYVMMEELQMTTAHRAHLEIQLGVVATGHRRHRRAQRWRPPPSIVTHHRIRQLSAGTSQISLTALQASKASDKQAYILWSLTGTAAQLLSSAEDRSLKLQGNDRKTGVVLAKRGWKISFRQNRDTMGTCAGYTSLMSLM